MLRLKFLENWVLIECLIIKIFSHLKDRNKIKTTIEKLEKNCQYKEVARMISGKDITEESIAAAKKLFN